MNTRHFHALCLAAPASGSGKTTVALALMAALRRRGKRVQPFKCGPDYIDPAYHRVAAGRPSYNLDTWMMGRAGVRRTWARHAAGADAAICEGVMGLFDACTPEHAEGSTADCARELGLPVALVVPVRGMAGSLAALARGFASHMPGLNLCGIIANGVGGERHASLLRRVLDGEGLPPLLGAFPRSEAWALPERHLGLVPPGETGCSPAWAEALARAAEACIDWERFAEACACARPAPVAEPAWPAPCRRLAVAQDEAFLFYYGEMEARLRRLGWEASAFSPLHDAALPEGVDAVYLGGGYPEVFAERLAENAPMRASLAAFAERGGEIYAECGGYMYLCDELVDAEGRRFPMCGVLRATARMGRKRRELGYRSVRWLGDPPFGLPRQDARGHEFHWSEVELHAVYPPLYAWSGTGGRSGEAGVVCGRVRAGYMHLFWGEEGGELPGVEQGISTFCPGGRVLLLNGASSAGKTSLAYALQEREPSAPWMVMSVDAFLAMCAPHAGRAIQTEDAARLPLIGAYHAGIAAAARAGAWVIADHVVGERREWMRDWERRMAGLPCRKICVECRGDILRHREEGRSDRSPDWEHARRQAAEIHAFLRYDACVDTSDDATPACAARLREALAAMGFCPGAESGPEPADRA